MSKEASRTTKSEVTKECWNCGRQHGRQPKELCAAVAANKTTSRKSVDRNGHAAQEIKGDRRVR